MSRAPLTGGAKYALVQQVVAALETDDLDALYVRLSLYGISVSDPEDWLRWNDADPRTYLLRHLPGADDEVLEALAADCGRPGRLDLARWDAGVVRLFASHTTANKDRVVAVKTALEPLGFDFFIAHEDLNPSDEWREAIEAGLSSCDVTVAFVHDDFYDSPWCEQEVGWALGAGKPVVSLVYTEEMRLRGFMAHRQAVYAQHLTAEATARRIHDAVALTPVRQRLRVAALSRLIEATSFVAAIASAKNVEACHSPLSADEATALQRAYGKNAQIHGSVGATPVVRRLLANAEKPPPDPSDEPF